MTNDNFIPNADNIEELEIDKEGLPMLYRVLDPKTFPPVKRTFMDRLLGRKKYKDPYPIYLILKEATFFNWTIALTSLDYLKKTDSYRAGFEVVSVPNHVTQNTVNIVQPQLSQLISKIVYDILSQSMKEPDQANV